MKWLMWLAFFGLVIAALYAKVSQAARRTTQASGRQQFESAGVETMVRCVHCGVYLPLSEAVHVDNAIYCCTDHCGKPALF